MSKQKTTATELVAILNKQYNSIVRNMGAINRKGEITDAIGNDLKRGDALCVSFDKTFEALKALGETVKFDESKGEYFIGANKYRIEYRMVSVGYVEIEAPTEQIALMKAEKMADFDKISLEVVSGTLKSVTTAA